MSHDEYKKFVSDNISKLDVSQKHRLESFSDSFEKLMSLNLDPVGDYMKSLYSNTGRPALNQPQIIRSFVLMLDLKYTSINKWVEFLKSDSLLAVLIGCLPDSLPPLGSYYDFIDRLWLQNPETEHLGRNDLLPCDKNKKPMTKPKKGKKLPNKHDGVVKQIAEFAASERDFPFYFEKSLQHIFSLAAVVPSLELGVIPKNHLTVCGDGTCVHTHSNPYGNKKCECTSKGLKHCSCKKHYSDPDASFGWDSDLNTFYFGYTMYALSTHNKELKTDLPIHIRFISAPRHDSVSGIVALSEFRKLHSTVKIENLCLDSANDNYATYELCKKWKITPFIDLNQNRGKPKTIPDNITISDDGTPICQSGYKMIYNGYCKGRSRHKWRCPLACGKETKCSCKEKCSSSEYGRCVYTKPEWDLRLYTPVPRGTTAYKEIYNNRTSSERINNRILNDYKLHSMKIHTRKRYSFFSVIAGINIHLNAQLKLKIIK